MLVATFGPTSEWPDKTISHDGNTFLLEDQGPITASDIMEYDRQGQLVWPTDMVHKWVRSQVRQPAPPSAAVPRSTESASVPLGAGGAAETPPEVGAGREAADRAEAEAAGQAEEIAKAEPVAEFAADVPSAPPPLDRYRGGFPRDAAVGILGADQSVAWVFETGESVPTPRRRASYITGADLQTGSGRAIRVPVVRGSGRVRYSVVGAAVIAADEISADLPSGSKVVLGFKVNEEYRILVSAYLPATKDVWDDVLKLGYAEAFPDERPADEEKHDGPGVAAGAGVAGSTASPAADEREPPEEPGVMTEPAPAAPAVEPAESMAVPADTPEPKMPAPPAAEDEPPVVADTLAVSSVEQVPSTMPTIPDFAPEPSLRSAADLADESASESARAVDVPPVPAPLPGPWPDFDRIDLAGRRGRTKAPADKARMAEAATTRSGLDLDLAAGDRGRQPPAGHTDEEILQRARGYLLANRLDEAAREVGRLGGSGVLLSDALDVLARVRFQQGHLDVAKSLWIQAEQLSPGVERYAKELEQVAEARGKGRDDGRRRRRTMAITAAVLAIVLVAIVLGAYACRGGGPDLTSTRSSPSPVVELPSAPGVVRETTQPPGFSVRVRGTSVRPTRTAAVLTFEQGLFASGSADILRPGRTVLLRLGDRLETHTQDLLVRVVGHTDSRPISGPCEYVDNVELGMARATAVFDFLRKEAGVPYMLLSAATVAATRPLASNATAGGRARNRTVVIEIAEMVR